MRRRILKESTVTASGDLKSFLSLCPEDSQGLSFVSMNGQEVLRKDFPGKGYLIVKPDFTYVKYNLDNTEKKENGKGRLAKCQAFIEKVTAPMGPDMVAAANGLMAKDATLKKIEDEGVREGIVTGTYVPVDLHTFNEESKKIFTQPNKYFLYRQKGLGGKVANVSPQITAWLTKNGWTLDEPTNIELWDTKQPLVTALKNLPGSSEVIKRISGELGKNVNEIMVYKTEVKSAEGVKRLDVFRDAVNQVKSKGSESDRQVCRTAAKALTTMAQLFNQNKSILQQMDSSELLMVKQYVYQCDIKRYLSGALGVRDEIDRLKRNSSPFGLLDLVNTADNQANMNESIDDYLKRALRKKLTVLSESKKKSVISNKEYGYYIKTIDEAFKTSGFGNNLINESDILSKALGIGGEGIIGYFKEKLANSIINKFVPGGADTWLGGMIATTIGNIKIGDYVNGNIFKCDFLIPLLAKSIGENAVKQFANNKGLTGGFYDVLRNSLVELVDDVPFIHKIEEGLGSVLCPVLGKLSLSLSSIFGSLGTELKQEFTPTK